MHGQSEAAQQAACQLTMLAWGIMYAAPLKLHDNGLYLLALQE